MRASPTVSIADGFLPHFAAAFTAHYGEQSQFVRAVSDLFTLAVAVMLERAGKLRNPADVALYADAPALAGLRALVAVAEHMKQPLLQEALGDAPIGCAAAEVDRVLGSGAFGAWLRSFEARDFERCRGLLQRPTLATWRHRAASAAALLARLRRARRRYHTPVAAFGPSGRAACGAGCEAWVEEVRTCVVLQGRAAA